MQFTLVKPKTTLKALSVQITFRMASVGFTTLLWKPYQFSCIVHKLTLFRSLLLSLYDTLTGQDRRSFKNRGLGDKPAIKIL